jgi:hypothetical protein
MSATTEPDHCRECGDPIGAHSTDLGCLLCACGAGRTTPITILDYVEHVVGPQSSYTALDIEAAGVPLMGGCEHCAATIAAYNAYPSRSGNWRCADCIGDTGFATVEDFADWDSARAPDQPDDPISCPSCRTARNVTEIAAHLFACSDCEATWTL